MNSNSRPQDPPQPSPRGPSLTDRILLFLLTHQQASMLLVAAVVGLGAGYGAVLFCRMIDGVQGLVVGSGEHILESLSDTSGWLIVAALMAAGVLVSPMVNILAREAKGHGVPEIMEAVALKGGRIRPRVSLVKALASRTIISSSSSRFCILVRAIPISVSFMTSFRKFSLSMISPPPDLAYILPHSVEQTIAQLERRNCVQTS